MNYNVILLKCNSGLQVTASQVLRSVLSLDPEEATVMLPWLPVFHCCHGFCLQVLRSVPSLQRKLLYILFAFTLIFLLYLLSTSRDEPRSRDSRLLDAINPGGDGQVMHMSQVRARHSKTGNAHVTGQDTTL